MSCKYKQNAQKRLKKTIAVPFLGTSICYGTYILLIMCTKTIHNYLISRVCYRYSYFITNTLLSATVLVQWPFCLNINILFPISLQNVLYKYSCIELMQI